jgi:hypothetical protein
VNYFPTPVRIVVFLILAVTSAAASAQSPTDNRDSASLFLGNTQDGSSHGFTMAIEYEHKLTNLIGIGGLFEYAGGDFDIVKLGVPVTFHPLAGWVFRAAPGVRFNSGTDLLFRAGVGYDFKIAPRWSIAPDFNVDFVDGDTQLVYGISAAYEF